MSHHQTKRGGAGAALILLCAFAASGALAAEPPSVEYVVSYVEGPTKSAPAVERSVQAYAARTRSNPARPTVEVLREIGRSNRLVVVERWPGAAQNAEVLAGELKGRLEGPLDRRAHHALTPLLTSGSSGAFHMLMHVDVAPLGADLAAKVLTAQRDAVLSAPGALQFEAAVQSDKNNHFTVHETWTSRAAYEAFAASPQAQQLREQFVPFKGAPFDDRFYVAASTGDRK